MVKQEDKKGSRYLGCIKMDVGVTWIGFLQIWASLFFLLRASTFMKIYQIFDWIIGAVYLLRAGVFVQMLSQNMDKDSRKLWYWTMLTTCLPLLVSILFLLAIKWVQFNQLPRLNCIAWLLVFPLNIYHVKVARDFYKEAVLYQQSQQTNKLSKD